jgi:tetratricopeptide (TPR) repeat protein
MKIITQFSILCTVLLLSACIAPVFALDQTPETVEDKLIHQFFGFAKPKWTYNGEDWQNKGDQYVESGNYENALHAYDKSLENYGVAIEEKEVEWSTKDARYNQIGTVLDRDYMNLHWAPTAQDLTPLAKQKIRSVLASKANVYKKTGDNENALSCVNSQLSAEPNDYNLLNEKVTLLKKLGRNEEAAQVQKLADANIPHNYDREAPADVLVLIGGLAGIFVLLKKRRS